jgi:hypothetical protein
MHPSPDKLQIKANLTEQFWPFAAQAICAIELGLTK